MRRFRACLLVLGLMGCAPLAFTQQQGSLSAGVRSEGRPVTGARVALLSGGRRNDFPATDASGNSANAVNIAELLNQYVEVWAEQCGPQTAPQVYFVAPGGKLSAPASGCLRHRAGFFILRGEGPWQVNTDVTLLAVTMMGPPSEVPATTAAEAEQKVSEGHPVWFQADGGAGVNLFPSASNHCSAIVAIEPGASCSIQDRTFAFLANGSVNISLFGAEGGFWRAGENRLVSNATLGGVPSSLVSTSQPRAFYVAGVVHLPTFAHLSIVPKAGATFWHIVLKQTQTSGSSSASTTASTDDAVNPFFGGAVETMITKHIGVGADYLYVRMKDDGVVNQTNHMAFAHLVIRFRQR